MTTQQWVDAVLRLVGYVISWPMVTAVVVIGFRKRIISTLSALSDRARKATVGPISVEFDETAVEALQDTARQAAREFAGNPNGLADFLGEQIMKMGEQTVTPDGESIAGGRVLWVDDNIRHNLFEMKYLQRLGVDLETATSTDEALRSLARQKFDVLITDMHRVEDGAEKPQAGLELIRQIDSRRRIPAIVYTSNALLWRDDAEISRYGAAVTDTASDLFAAVRNALRRRSPGSLSRLIPGQRR